MHISITFLSTMLTLTSTGFGRPSRHTPLNLLRHELAEESPAQSGLLTLSVESSTESPTSRGTTEEIRNTVTRVHTILETILTTSTITAGTEDTSMCPHTHSADGFGLVTHMMPCSFTGIGLVPPPTTPIITAADAQITEMCAHTHTQNGTAFFTHTIACSLRDKPLAIGGDDVNTEQPFSHTPCTTCDTLTSTITSVNPADGITSLATTTKTINRVCPTCNWSLVNVTKTYSGINTVTITTEMWQFPETTLPLTILMLPSRPPSLWHSPSSAKLSTSLDAQSPLKHGSK